MTRFEHRNHPGVIATIIHEDEVRRTVMLELNDGSVKTITTSTLKRYWKQLKDDNIKDTKKESNLVPMPGAEKLEDLKKEYPGKETIKKSEPTKTAKNTDSNNSVDIVPIINSICDSLGIIVKYNPNVPRVYELRYNNCNICEVYTGKSTFRVGLRSKCLPFLSNGDLFAKRNYMLDISAAFSYTDDVDNILKNLITIAKEKGGK